MDAAGSSATALAQGTTTPTAGAQAVFGPCLHADMTPQQTVEALNAWGSARDRESQQLRADLTSTQREVSSAFVQAQGAVQELVGAFRMEVAAMRQTTMWEAQQSLERLEQVVSDARARFGEQDARFTAGLNELAQRLQAADAWARDEPARVAALLVSAAPAPPAPAPGWTTPPAAGVGRMGSPGHAAEGPVFAYAAGDSWGAYAAGRAAEGPAPPDAWARSAQPQPQQPQQQPQQPPH